MLPIPTKVLARRQEIRDVWTLDIEPPAHMAGGDFGPGQFNMLYAFGVGEVPISMSGMPGVEGPLRHTVRDVGAISRAIASMAEGETLGLRGPFGSEWPVERAAGGDVILVAGGLGLAPLRPAFYKILAERDRYHQIALLYGSRSPEDILFREELEQWRGRLDLDVQVTVDHATGDWHGSVGVVGTLIPRLSFDPANTTALICGPEVMMRFVAEALTDAGVSDQRMYLSMERNMKCALGHCGHCQFGSDFICKDGPILRYDHLRRSLKIREL